jgi:CxxC motif-containing protein
METETEIICITCPKGCPLKVRHEGDKVIEIIGAGCRKGKEYAICELQDPRRMIASTVKIRNGLHPLLPVFTEKAFPKPLIHQLANLLREIEVEAPFEINQPVLRNALDTGIDILSSRDMPKK